MDVPGLLQAKHIDFDLKGQDYMIRCLNPEHDDTNPSMRIDSLTGIYHCFSCGFKGNIFTLFDEKANFLQMKRDLFRRKLTEKLAENIGLTLPENRVIFNREWRNIRGSTYEAFEAFEHNDKDFIGRLVFPIRSLAGKVIGYNARALSPEVQPKYLISPPRAKFPLWPTRVEHISGCIILVEGLFDAINLHDKGLTNAVCAFGTKKVTKDKLNILKIQGVTGVDVFFDGDEAGQTAAKEVIELIESVELTARNISIANTDPGELTAQKVLKLKEKLYGNSGSSGDQA